MNSLKATNYLLLAIAVWLAGLLLHALLPKAQAQAGQSAVPQTRIIGCYSKYNDGRCTEFKPVLVDKMGRLLTVAEK